MEQYIIFSYICCTGGNRLNSKQNCLLLGVPKRFSVWDVTMHSRIWCWTLGCNVLYVTLLTRANLVFFIITPGLVISNLKRACTPCSKTVVHTEKWIKWMVPTFSLLWGHSTAKCIFLALSVIAPALYNDCLKANKCCWWNLLKLFDPPCRRIFWFFSENFLSKSRPRIWWLSLCISPPNPGWWCHCTDVFPLALERSG